jgi:hypothetical protein
VDAVSRGVAGIGVVPACWFLSEFGDELAGPAGGGGGTGAEGFEVAEGGAGVEERVVPAPGIRESDGGREAGRTGPVAVVLAFVVLDGLDVVGERLVGLAGTAVDAAERAVGDGQVVGRVVRDQLECRVVGVSCVVEVSE